MSVFTCGPMGGIAGMVLLLLPALAVAAPPLALTPDDAIARPGEKALLSAWLARGGSLAFKQDLRGAEVKFYLDRKLIGTATTDSLGRATVYAEVPPRHSVFRAISSWRGQKAQSTGRVFHWHKDRTIVAVDVDGTISHTNYSDLFITQFDEVSKPLDGARDALTGLSKDYQILYISARPRFLTEKTRRWLDSHEFPAGPVAHALGFDACLHQGTAKREICMELRKRWPNLLIGIGDKGADDRAFGPNGMLTLIVNSSPGAYKKHCVMLETWPHVEQFLTSHKKELASAPMLAQLIDQHHDDLPSFFEIQ